HDDPPAQRSPAQDHAPLHRPGGVHGPLLQYGADAHRQSGEEPNRAAPVFHPGLERPRVGRTKLTGGHRMAPSYRVISADSHLEPAVERWTPRVPARYRDQAPRRARLPNGRDATIPEGA